MLSALFDCENVEEIINNGYENALLLVTKAIDKIMIGGEDITQDDLIIHKLLGQDIIKYRSLFPHVSAAIQLSNNEDKLPSKGDTIKYIYTNSQHKNPLCRVATIDSINGKKEERDYDKDNDATDYGHLPTPNCCHISAILPPEIRNKSKPVIVTGLSPGGMPTTSFLGVPVIVHRINTLSPFATTSS